jgi:hypothetical protein
VTKAEGKLQLARLARCDERMADLQSQVAHVAAERARILREMAGEAIELGTGRRIHARREPEIPEPTELDRHRAQRALQSNRLRRKVRS